MSSTRSNAAELVSQLPDSDKPGAESKFTGPPPDLAWKLAIELLDGGREALLELIELISDGFGGGAGGYRAGYLLHCAALHAGRPGEEARRKLFVDAVASRLGSGGSPPGAQAFLVREIQAAGGEEAVEALGKLLEDDGLCGQAAQSLVAIGGRSGARLRAALPGRTGKSRMAVIQALGALRDAESVAALRAAAKEPDPEARIAAVWALARSGDPAASDTVLAAADGAEGWERIQAAKACLILAERLVEAGNPSEARRIYSRIRETRKDPGERYLLEAAERGLRMARV
ncbi:MAG TPA: HEAT repeat domain-containing protein [Planctomycetota bacterium]|nr:HEAT repeat domain-containing protein [Planctomycetota bacterium]